jgi:uncharacterized repeat protein (TIGR01451 family)
MTAMRRRLVPAFCFLATLLAGIAGAESPPAAPVYEVLGTRVDGKGPPPMADKVAAPRNVSVAPLPQAWTSGQYPIEVEPNDTSATATPLTGTASQREGNIFPAADVDFWSFTAAAGDRVYAATMTSLSSNASVDSVLDLIGTDGTTVIETDADDGSFGATSSSIAGATLPAAGTYYLRVRHASAATQLRPYRLFFQLRSGTPTAETEPNDTFPGTALPAGGWVSGNTSATTDADFYTLNLNAGDTVFVSVDLDPERDTTEWNAQIGVGAFGAPPLVLVANDAGAATPDSEAFFLTADAAGTYGVLVGLPTGGTTFGTYHASVTVFPKVDDGVNCTTYTSTNVPITIADGPSIQTSTLTIPGNPRIEDLDVAVNITHNFMADLDVQLTAPGGNTVSLFSDIGSVTAGSQTTMSTTFDDEAAVPSLFAIINGNRVAPELNYRLSWFDGQPAGGTWTLTLRDDASGDGGTLNSWSLRVCEAPPPPACAPGFEPVTVLTTDFESGDAGFTHSGTADEWERGNPTSVPVTGCNSGANCWKTDLDNTYEASSNQELLSPNINLAGLSPPIVVSWAQKFQIEAAQFDTFSIDLRQVGNPANGVNLFRHLGADMVDNAGNPVVVIQESAGWGVVSARADTLAGQNVEFAARLTSDTTVQRAGLAIDDFSITACRLAEADLSITKTDGVTTATPGGSVTYTITASNAGPSPAPSATVADTFPASLTCNWTCVGAGGGTCTASGSGNINDAVNLPVGGSTTYTATCAVSAAATGTLANTATVSSTLTDPVPANNSATDTDTLTPSTDLGITKTDGVTNVSAGGSTTYTITASNAGPSNATGATVTDTFPAALTCNWTCTGAGGGTCTASGSGNINGTVNLPVGGSVTYSAVCSISGSATGSLINTATVAAPAGATDPTPGNNSATDTDTVIPSADLSVTKTDGVTTVTAGGTTTYTITAANAGPSPATGAAVTDTFPAALTCTWTCSGAGGGTCTASGSGNIADSVNLPVGASVTYSAACSISASATGSLVNTATVATPGGVVDPTPANNSATDTNGIGSAADLSVTKTDGVSNVAPGGNTVYTIVASNAGPSAASGISVTDTFPAGLTCTWICSAGAGATCTASGAGNIADSISLNVGATATYVATCAVAASVTGSLSNTATVSSAVTDPNPANNSATDTDTVDLSADLSITKSDGVTTVSPGGTLTYTIVASNAGPSPVTSASVLEIFPAECISATWTCSASGGGACPASGSGSFNAGVDLPPGAAATFVASCTVDPASLNGTVISNTATITAQPGTIEPDPSDNSATDTTTVNATGAIVTATKSVAGNLGQGGTVTYTIVLSNTGTAQNDNPGDEFVDVLPATLTLLSASASSGTAIANTGTDTVTWNGAIPSGGNVTITITAQIPLSASGSVSNQGTVSFDGDADGVNEASGVTDDPGVSGAGNATVFGIQVIVAVPVLGLPALLLLALGLLMLGACQRRRLDT